MAIDRIDTDEIIQEILDITGYTSSTVAPWKTDARLIIKINLVAHRIPQKVRQIAIAQGLDGRLGLPMWWTTINSAGAGVGNFVVASGTAIGSLPADFDMGISVYDVTHKRPIEIVKTREEQWYHTLREAPAGPSRKIHFQDHAGGAQRQYRLLPDVVTGVTPSLRMEYYRLPTDVASGSSSFPDADYKYHYLWILETVLDILRPDTPNYDRYLALEKEMLVEMAESAVL